VAAAVGFAALVIMMMTMLRILDVFSKLQGEAAGFAKQNAFSTLLVNSVGLEWGWMPLIGGALAVLAAGLISASEGVEDNSVGHTQTDGNGPAPFSFLDDEPDSALASNIEQKIARRVQEIAPQKPVARSFGKRIAH
jgi:hypothetical protein